MSKLSSLSYLLSPGPAAQILRLRSCCTRPQLIRICFWGIGKVTYFCGSMIIGKYTKILLGTPSTVAELAITVPCEPLA